MDFKGHFHSGDGDRIDPFTLGDAYSRFLLRCQAVDRANTEQVRSVPLLVVPPMINRYYILDLAPGRSLIEYCVRQGQQVFAISWRNPDARHRGWNVDTYAQAIAEALEAACAIVRAGSGHVLALCSGGVVAVRSVGAVPLVGPRRL